MNPFKRATLASSGNDGGDDEQVGLDLVSVELAMREAQRAS